jgi:hypothetical protein
MDAGDALLVFVEGTRSRDGAMRRALPGVARYLDYPDALLVPIGLAGTQELVRIGDERLHRARISARVGPPLESRVLLERCRNRRGLIMDAVGFAIAELLPAAYRGAYAGGDPGLEPASDLRVARRARSLSGGAGRSLSYGSPPRRIDGGGSCWDRCWRLRSGPSARSDGDPLEKAQLFRAALVERHRSPEDYAVPREPTDARGRPRAATRTGGRPPSRNLGRDLVQARRAQPDGPGRAEAMQDAAGARRPAFLTRVTGRPALLAAYRSDAAGRRVEVVLRAA